MQSISTKKAILTLVDDRIIYFEVNDKVVFELADMLEVRVANAHLSNGQPYCVLMESKGVSSFSHEMMKESASSEHSKNRIALAILTTNLGMRIITNFYLKVNKPVGITKAFNSREQAIIWLKNQRDKSNFMKPEERQKAALFF